MINLLYGHYLKVKYRMLGAMMKNSFLKAFVLVPLFMVFGKRWEKQHQDRVAKASLARTRWFEEHTDPVFGRPPESAYSNKDRLTPDGKMYEVCRYQPPFRNSTLPALEVDQFPSVEQKSVFLWLEKKMDDVAQLVPGLLLVSSENDIEPGAFFFRTSTPEVAAAAFDPKYIRTISLKGARPVRWTIYFDATIDQDVYGQIEGEDEITKKAHLFM